MNTNLKKSIDFDLQVFPNETFLFLKKNFNFFLKKEKFHLEIINKSHVLKADNLILNFLNFFFSLIEQNFFKNPQLRHTLQKLIQKRSFFTFYSRKNFFFLMIRDILTLKDDSKIFLKKIYPKFKSLRSLSFRLNNFIFLALMNFFSSYSVYWDYKIYSYFKSTKVWTMF